MAALHRTDPILIPISIVAASFVLMLAYALIWFALLSAPAVVVAWILGYSLLTLFLKIWRFVWGLNLPANDGPGAKCSIEAVAALETLVVAQVVGLIAYAWGKEEFQGRVLLIYAVSACIPIVGFVAVLNGSAMMNNLKVHAHDRSTVMFTQWTLACSFALVVLVGALYATDNLPGMGIRKAQLEVVTARPYRFENESEKLGIRKGDVGLEAFVRFTPAELEKSTLPNPLEVQVSLNTELTESWQIIEAYGYDEGLAQVLKMDSDSLKSLGTHAILFGNSNPFEKQILFYDLQPRTEYTVRLLLHRQNRGKGPVELAELIRKEPLQVVGFDVILPK